MTTLRLAVSLSLFVACGTVTLEPSRVVERTVTVPVPFEPSEAGPGHRLRWRFTDRQGQVGEGLLDDPRVVRSEFDETGRADPKWSVDPTMTLQLRLPNLGGELVIEDERGRA